MHLSQVGQSSVLPSACLKPVEAGLLTYDQGERYGRLTRYRSRAI